MSDVQAEQPPERPEWLQENFQTPEDQARAYAESRKEMDRMRSQMETERAQYTAALDAIEQRALQQQPVAQAPVDNSFDPLVAAYERAYNEGDAAAMLRIQAQASQGPTIEAVGRLLDDKFKEFTPSLEQSRAAQRSTDIRLAEELVKRELGPERYQELYPEISGIIQENPNFLPDATSVEGYATSILNVAKLAEHSHLKKSLADMETERAEKLAAQPVANVGNRSSAFTPDQQKVEWDRIRNAPDDSYSSMMNRGS